MCGRIVCFDGPWPWSCVLDLEVVAKEPGLRSTRRLCWIACCSFSTPTSLCGGRRTPRATGTTSTTTCTPCRAHTNLCTTLPSIGARRARDGPWALACSDAGRVDGCERRGHWSHFTFNLYSKNSYLKFRAKLTAEVDIDIYISEIKTPPCRNTFEKFSSKKLLRKFS